MQIGCVQILTNIELKTNEQIYTHNTRIANHIDLNHQKLPKYTKLINHVANIKCN